MNEFLELENFSLCQDKGHSYFEFNPDNTFTFWTDFEYEKYSDEYPTDYIYETTMRPYEGKFRITSKIIELDFNDGNKIMYNYELISQSNLLLKIKK